MNEKPIFFNIDEFSKPLKSKPTPVPPHVSRAKRMVMQHAARRKSKASSGTITIKDVLPDDFKAARIKLKLEPYDPDARDGDGDGIVQEGTAWERPAGARILDAAGKEIQRGFVSNRQVAGARIVDSTGRDVRYSPSWSTQKPRGPRPMSPERIGDSLPSVGDVARSPKMNARVDAELRAALDQLKEAVSFLQKAKKNFRGQMFPERDGRILRTDPSKTGKVNWTETEEAKRAYDALDRAGALVQRKLQELMYGGPVPPEAQEQMRRAEEMVIARREFRNKRNQLMKDREAVGYDALIEQFEQIRQLSKNKDVVDVLTAIIKKMKTDKTRGEYSDYAFTAQMIQKLGSALRAEARLSGAANMQDTEMGKKVKELFLPFYQQQYGKNVDHSLSDILMRLSDKNDDFLRADTAREIIARFKGDEIAELDKLIDGGYPKEIDDEAYTRVSIFTDRLKNQAAAFALMQALRSDAGAGDLFEIFDKDSIKAKERGYSREQVIEGFQRVAEFLPGDWLQLLADLTINKQPVLWIDRGHYSAGQISISPGGFTSWEDVLAHELGHAFEDWVPGIVLAEHLFYRRRAEQLYGDKPPKPRTVSRSGNFPQKGIDLKLSDAYADVFYEGGRHGEMGELFSTSLQRLYDGTWPLMPNEQLRFTLGVLALL